MHIHTCTNIDECILIGMQHNTYMYASTYLCLYKYTCVNIHLYTHTYIQTYNHTYKCIYTHIHIFICIYIMPCGIAGHILHLKKDFSGKSGDICIKSTDSF